MFYFKQVKIGSVVCVKQVKIGIPPQKLAKKLPAGTKFTSPVAQVLAGAYRKAVGGQAPPLEGIASGITAALNARSVLHLQLLPT